jgi:hypothetical protein
VLASCLSKQHAGIVADKQLTLRYDGVLAGIPVDEPLEMAANPLVIFAERMRPHARLLSHCPFHE